MRTERILFSFTSALIFNTSALISNTSALMNGKKVVVKIIG